MGLYSAFANVGNIVITYIDNSPSVSAAFGANNLEGFSAAMAGSGSILGSVVGAFPISVQNATGIGAVGGFLVAVKISALCNLRLES